VLSHHNISNEVLQAQGVDDKTDDDDKNNHLPQIPELEEVEDNSDGEHANKDSNEVDDSLDDYVNRYESEEQEDMSECVANDEHQRIYYVTKRGRSVKMRKDLFDNYDFLQEDTEDASNSDRVKSLSTQWSLKQGLRFFPE
jgi:hypothetical protein